ncbi:hypothetical protein EMIHUDRAFT_241232 [Emiliania huxleyi CCMP1516]|uniref:SCP domain-containing protein n=2 Tax=Emiliania huxleyi TaxID=2903 RepID=A0A0D3JD19_EMIH1|nr:hypothetical protein EMIHUDRAFT_241232 [Emiliania huxleyi CCMP1516]EOD21404.1 hypothetical protein EMIHUDRAFT_241232 [Emiliania huxleyi CCMP1516]|eukprot:XP_005773833.1 hypothetical protein EMIHUDRAFT_241232 [Emiliania huxleyi CCMP1516]
MLLPGSTLLLAPLLAPPPARHAPAAMGGYTGLPRMPVKAWPLTRRWNPTLEYRENIATLGLAARALRPLASGKRLATDYAEATKRKAKAAACDAKNCDFMTWAASTRGGIGHEAATWFNTNFDIKAAKASSDSERWRVSSERKRFLQVHSTIVARRNAAIFDYNAWPKMGGEMPRAPRVQYE